MIHLTTTIGGRTLTPALPIVDGAPPNSTELSFNASLSKYIAANVPLESEEGIRARERVLVKMGKLHREWVRSVALKRGLNADAVESAGGELFTSGSYRLGVHEPGADIGRCGFVLILIFPWFILLGFDHLTYEIQPSIISAVGAFRHHRRGAQLLHPR